MERKKRSRHSSITRKPTQKPKRKSPSVFKTNIVLLAIIFGAGIMLLAGRFLFVLPELPTNTVSPPIEQPAYGEPERVNPVLQPTQQTSERAPPQEKPVHSPVDTSPEKFPQVLPSVQTPVAQRPPVEKPFPPKKKGTLVFVFDDAGHNLAQLTPFLELPFPCTIAVLPGLQYSAESARRIRKSSKDCILHQPMQAVNLSINPGPGAVRQGMTPSEIRDVVRANLDELAPVTGMNNHEGSLITADRTAMAAVLDVIQERGLYFLDSRTTAETAVPALARERNIKILERAVFLDNSQDRNSIIEAVYNGMKVAERNGSAVMIGHIWSSDLAEILTEMYPELVNQGFSLSTIAKLSIIGDEDE